MARMTPGEEMADRDFTAIHGEIGSGSHAIPEVLEAHIKKTEQKGLNPCAGQSNDPGKANETANADAAVDKAPRE